MKKVPIHTFEHTISLGNLLEAWQEFLHGKRNKPDVQEFQSMLMDNLISLQEDLRNRTYHHGPYQHFKIADPKPRDIHKASVRDRLLHHALHRVLYPYFEAMFMYSLYSSRVEKGTHKALNRFRLLAHRASRAHSRTIWALKCDIRKFFASIDHQVLFSILERHIADQDILWLLREVVGSFSTQKDILTFLRKSECPKGLPLGNLTSQLLVNIYMNEFDQYVKHKLKVKYYVRYADDFVILSHDKTEPEERLRYIVVFLDNRLKLKLHSDKVSIKTFASGVDFLGWVHFPDHRVLRTATKKRMFRKLQQRQGQKGEEATKQSYLGMLKHGNTHGLRRKI